MSHHSSKQAYDLKEAPEEIKELIRITQTAEPVEADENRFYALYSEPDENRRHVAITEYLEEHEVFKMDQMIKYDQNEQEIIIREMRGRSNPLMTAKKVPEYNLKSAKSLLESD